MFLQDLSTGWQRRGQNQTKQVNKRHADRNLKAERSTTKQRCTEFNWFTLFLVLVTFCFRTELVKLLVDLGPTLVSFAPMNFDAHLYHITFMDRGRLIGSSLRQKKENTLLWAVMPHAFWAAFQFFLWNFPPSPKCDCLQTLQIHLLLDPSDYGLDGGQFVWIGQVLTPSASGPDSLWSLEAPCRPPALPSPRLLPWNKVIKVSTSHTSGAPRASHVTLRARVSTHPPRLPPPRVCQRS